MSDHANEHRVLVLPPTERDGALSLTVLTGAGVTAVACPNVGALCRGLEAGAGAAVLTEEAILADRGGCLATLVREQPPWSDLPLIVLMGGGTDSQTAALALETLGNVTLLDRPVRVATLVSAVRAALRSRRKQYEVRDYLAERARAAAELRDADARKNEFIAMLAHELRNPLAPVRNALAVFRARADGDPAATRLGAMMERQVSHLVRLVDDLLDVSRVTRGKVELRRERVDLVVVAARAAEGARGSLAERQHRLEVELPPGPVWIDADSDRVEQVVDNLLSNAGKYTEPGGRVRLAVRQEGADAVVRVRDNGIGLRPEAIPRLFELFMQSDRLPGRVSEGLGLGLALVKTLVEMHGGTVSATSPGPGKGSEFTVRLPAVAAPAPGGSGPTVVREDGPRPALPLRVLVCDDNEDGAESMATLLGLLGYEVRVCHDGPAALDAAREFDPDVCLLDIGLPKGMDGYEVARRLRGAGRAGMFLAALTGYGQDEDRRRSAEAGFQAHLVKPVDPKTLTELLGRVTRRDRPS